MKLQADAPKCAVYRIRSVKTGEGYIGGSTNIPSRFRSHFSGIRCGSHINRHLVNLADKNGIDDLVFEIVEKCRPSEVYDREKRWVESERPALNTCFPTNKKFVSLSTVVHPKIKDRVLQFAGSKRMGCRRALAELIKFGLDAVERGGNP